MTSVLTIPMEATARARLPKIPRNTSSTLKNVWMLRLASIIEKVVNPIFLMAASTVCTWLGFATFTLTDW